MKELDVTQGTPEWHAARANCFTASEAPAMMGASKYKTRSELLRQKALGTSDVVDENKQRLFDRGHRSEAGARLLVADMINSDLYPVTAVWDRDERILASLDGLTMDETIAFEHKLWNPELAAAVMARDLDPHYYWQLEQQLLVTGAEKVFFVCSDGTRENFVCIEYRPVPGRAEALIAGWKQFAEDLANYAHVKVVAPAVAKPVESLPAVSVQVQGALIVASNLPEFGVALRTFIQGIPAKPETDQEFADAEAACKTLKKAEDALESSENAALSTITDVQEMRKVVADLRALARATRLTAEKNVTLRKEQIRAEILAEGKAQVMEHIAHLNTRLGNPSMPQVGMNFADAMKGKKTVTSLRDAVAGEVARCKIEANAIADKIQINLNTLRELASDHAFLFSDTALIVGKANDDLVSLIKSRISDYKEAEAKKAADKLAEQQRQFEEQERAEIARLAKLNAAMVVEAPAPAVAAPAANVVTMQPRPAVAPTSPPSLKLGQIAERLGFTVTADFLASLGFEAHVERNARLYHERDFTYICCALVDHINSVQAKQAA